MARVMDSTLVTNITKLTTLLHGDGLFEFHAGRSLVGKNGWVYPGKGLSILVGDYIGLLDGLLVSHRGTAALDDRVRIPLTIPGSGTFFVWLENSKDREGKKIHGKGVLSIKTREPIEDEAILLAKVTVPAGATQITEGMIDNGVKKYVPDVQQSFKMLRQNINDYIEQAKRKIYELILNQFTEEVRQEIAAGEERILSELNSRIEELLSILHDKAIKLEVFTSKFNEFANFVNQKVEMLDVVSEELRLVMEQVRHVQFETQQFRELIYQEIIPIAGELAGFVVEFNALKEMVSKNLEEIQAQIFREYNKLWQNLAFVKTNLVKVGLQIQTIFGIFLEPLHQGILDALLTDENIDFSLSQDIQYDSNEKKVIVAKKIEKIEEEDFFEDFETFQVGGELPSDWWVSPGWQPHWVIKSIEGKKILDSVGWHWVNPFMLPVLFSEGTIEIRYRFKHPWEYNSILGVAFHHIRWRSHADHPFEESLWVELCGEPFWRVEISHVQWWGKKWSIHSSFVPDTAWHRLKIQFSKTDYSIKVFIDDALYLEAIAPEDARLTFSPFTPIVIWARGYQPVEIDWIKVFKQIAQAIPCSEGFFVTKSFDFGIVPQQAFVVVEGKNLDAYISRDDGANYIQVSPNVFTSFGDVPEGTQIRLKIHLKTPDSELDNYAFFVK